MDESQQSFQADKAHDLRHQLALLALDLRLCREQMACGEGDPAVLVPPLLERLERGLERGRRIAAGQSLAFSEAAADRSGLVQEIWDRFRSAGRLAGNAELRMPRPWLFPGSEDELHALLLNLLENASSAAPEGPLSLVLEGGSITLENGGQPLPLEIARELHEGRAPRARGSRGRGLGEILGIARRLGLELEVDVENGERTRMTLRRAGGPRLLLVEDDPGLRAMLAELMRRWGFHVDEAAAFEDLDLASGPWRVAVADRGLPGEPGDRGLARLKQADPGLRTIMLTGALDRSLEDAEGVDRVLIKPGLAALQEELITLLGSVP